VLDVVKKSEWYAKFRSSNREFNRGVPKPFVNNAEEGYLIQTLVLEKLGWNVGGWKLGGTNKFTRERFCCNKAYFGPIEKNHIFFAEEYKNPILHVDTLQGEPEIAFRVKKTINRRSFIQSPCEVLKYFDYFAPALECPVSGISPHNYVNLGDLLADLCGSGYLIIGRQLELTMLSSAIDTVVNVRQNDKVISSGTTSEIIGTVINSLVDFFDTAVSIGVEIEVGQWIATGGCAPCSIILPNREVIVDFEGLDPFGFEFTDALVG